MSAIPVTAVELELRVLAVRECATLSIGSSKKIARKYKDEALMTRQAKFE